MKSSLSGQYSSWLGHHQETLENCVHLCINALSNPELIQSASIALKELTMENRLHMSKYLNDIFPIIKVKEKNLFFIINFRFLFDRMFLRMFMFNLMIVFVVLQLLVIFSLHIHQKLLSII